MIYLDTSVALAHLLAEDRQPPASLRSETLISSRLLEYEMRVALDGLGLTGVYDEAARRLIGRVALLELTTSVLARALEPFPGPGPLRTIDALHLASCSYLTENGQTVALASFDRCMITAARSMNMPLFESDDPDSIS